VKRFDPLPIADIHALFEHALKARRIHTVFWHASASDRPEHDSAEVIHSWHLARGWSEIGYHGFIQKSGTLQLGRDWRKVPSAQGGYNPGTLAFCLHGLAKDKFTPAQEQTMRAIAQALPKTLRHRGHCEVSAKLCPVVDYQTILGLDRHGFLAERQVSSSAHPVVRLFDRGPAVEALQQALVEQGADLLIDGLFGRATLAALRAFQQAKGLRVDGVAGQETWSALA
jgi:hypothetical protein